jgi:hypothetical protein
MADSVGLNLGNTCTNEIVRNILEQCPCITVNTHCLGCNDNSLNADIRITSAYSENHMEPINAVCKQRIHLLNSNYALGFKLGFRI